MGKDLAPKNVCQLVRMDIKRMACVKPANMTVCKPELCEGPRRLRVDVKDGRHLWLALREHGASRLTEQHRKRAGLHGTGTGAGGH